MMVSKRKLRLLVTSKCNRSCEGCCNLDWDLDALPVVEDWHAYAYDEIIVTGGEPLLFPEKLQSFMQSLTEMHTAPKLYLYTAKPDVFTRYPWLLKYFDGLTITLHEPSDWIEMVAFDNLLIQQEHVNPFCLSIRINHFKAAGEHPIENMIFKHYKWDLNREWLTDCPLPSGEEFRKIERLW
jgi:hypothetical protein